MEQRTLRLGDIVDDYCPRERRITNHAIVAIVEDAIRQTRCTTCDAEHTFKHGREPRRRRKEAGTLYDQVLADVTGAQLVPPRPAEHVTSSESQPAEVPTAVSASPSEAPAVDETTHVEEAWPAHRPLIRASLPKIEGEAPPPRPIPEFTMHQRPQPRPGRGFRFGGHAANGNTNGGGQTGRPFRSQGQQGYGNGPGPNGPRGEGSRAGRRRSHKRGR